MCLPKRLCLFKPGSQDFSQVVLKYVYSWLDMKLMGICMDTHISADVYDKRLLQFQEKAASLNRPPEQGARVTGSFVTRWLDSTLAWKLQFFFVFKAPFERPFTIKHTLWKLARTFSTSAISAVFCSLSHSRLKEFYWWTMLAITAICCSPPVHASVMKPPEFIYKTDKKPPDGKHTRSCFHYIKS